MPALGRFQPVATGLKRPKAALREGRKSAKNGLPSLLINPSPFGLYHSLPARFPHLTHCYMGIIIY
jgi:hypothetical protein